MNQDLGAATNAAALYFATIQCGRHSPRGDSCAFQGAVLVMTMGMRPGALTFSQERISAREEMSLSETIQGCPVIPGGSPDVRAGSMPCPR